MAVIERFQGVPTALARLQNFVVDLIAPAGQEQHEAVGRFVILILLALLLVPSFLIEFLLAGHTGLAAALAIAGAFMLVSPLVYKQTGRLSLARDVFLGSLFGFKLWECIYFGTAFSPGAIWFATMPVASVLFGSARAGFGWLLVTLTTIVVLFTLQAQGGAFPDASTFWFAHLYAFSLICVISAMFLFVLMVDAARRSAFRRLEAANRAIKELAERDPLTGLFNRRYIWEVLEREQAQARMTSDTFSVLLLDVDRFKRINDTFGHAVGDAVLQAIAGALEAQVGGAGCCGRYGGEEFIVLLGGEGARSPAAVAERLRRKVEALCFDYVAGPEQVTISVGYAQFRNSEGFAETLHRADKALYAAKESGRNRIMPAPTGKPVLVAV